MRFIKKILSNFFLYLLFITVLSSNINNLYGANERSSSILDRLPTSIFATVNNEPISIYDLIQRANLFSISSKIPINTEFETKILPDLISGYIDEMIREQEIKKFNLNVPEQQIQQIVASIEKENGFEEGQFEIFLSQNKTDISILEKQLKTQIGWKQLVANKYRPQVVIQDSEVEAIIRKLESNIGKDEFLMEQIFLSFEGQNEAVIYKRITNIYEQLSDGGDFQSIAKQFSDSYGGQSGDIGWVAETELDQKIVNKIKNLEVNKISQPLKGESGYFIIKKKNKRIIGQEVIASVSLFRFRLNDENDEVISLMNEIKDCNELENFSKVNATSDSGSLGDFNYNELSDILKSSIKDMKKNQISDLINFGNEKFRIMLCDIKKTKPMIPSKFKIEEILVNRKLDVIANQYMSELRTKAIIDIRI